MSATGNPSGNHGHRKKAATTGRGGKVPPADATRDQVLHAALKSSLLCGKFVDTKFYAYSSRTQTGTVNKPLPVFANSLTMRMASPHFERLLSGGFLESRTTSLDVDHHLPQDLTTDDYGYNSDSDLEEEEEGDLDETQPAAMPHPNSRMVDMSDDEQVSDGSFNEKVENAAELSIAHGETGEKASGRAAASLLDSGRVGRTIYIKDIAFKTWEAFIFYIYTGQVQFTPLKSQTATIRDENIDERTLLIQPPRCSPKSMYRLAEKYDMKELKELAAKDLQWKLSKENILTEVFSEFTSRYPEISAKQVEYLHTNLQGTVASQLPKWMESVAAGQLPHSSDVLVSLFQKMMSTTAPVPTPAPAPAEPVCSYGCRSGYDRICRGCSSSM